MKEHHKDYIELINKRIKEEIEDKIALEFLLAGGKRIRPIMCFEAYKIWEEELKEDIILAALSIELFHNFTLIHDDIEDRSKTRRGLPCLYIKYDIPLAMHVGDQICISAYKVLLKLGKENFNIIKEINDAYYRVLEGQGQELNLNMSNRWDINEDIYFDIIDKKTASLFGVATKVGALTSNHKDKNTIDALYKFGRFFGMAFQIHNDICNIVEETPNQASDITEAKRSIIIIRAIEKLNKTDRDYLIKILNMKTEDNYLLQEAIKIIHSCDALHYAEKKKEFFINKAIDAIKNIKNDIFIDIIEECLRKK